MSWLRLLLLAPLARLAAPLCVLSEDAVRCSCDVEGLRSPAVCVPASELQVLGDALNASDYLENLDLLTVLRRIRKLTLVNVSTLPLRPYDLQLLDFFLYFSSPIQVLELVGSRVDPSLLQSSFHNLLRWLLSYLDTFSLLGSGLVEPDYYWASMLKNLRGLDLSGTQVSSSGLRNLSGFPAISFARLTRVGLSGCGLTSLSGLCELLGRTPVLAELDLSQNPLGGFPRCLQEVSTLQVLNLSRCRLTQVGSWWSGSLQVLDLSHNYLEVLAAAPPALTALTLTGNRLLRLPPLLFLTQLRELKVDDNQLSTLTNHSITTCGPFLPQLRLLRAGGNPYRCDCQLNESIVFLREHAEDWPDRFQCATPPGAPPTKLSDLSFENCTAQSSGGPRRLRPLCEMTTVALLCTAALIF